MKKADHSIYVFFRACGVGIGETINSKNSKGDYWSLSSRNSTYAEGL